MSVLPKKNARANARALAEAGRCVTILKRQELELAHRLLLVLSLKGVPCRL